MVGYPRSSRHAAPSEPSVTSDSVAEMVHGAPPSQKVPPRPSVRAYAMADIPSLRLGCLLAPLLAGRDRPEAERHPDWPCYEERLDLAQWACTRTRLIAEAALGPTYMQQPEAQERIIQLALHLLCDPDDEKRARYRQRRAEEQGTPPIG